MISEHSEFGRSVGLLATALGIPKKQARALVHGTLCLIARIALDGRNIETPIGTFRKATSVSRNIRNPATKKQMTLPPTYRLAFRSTKAFKGVVK